MRRVLFLSLVLLLAGSAAGKTPPRLISAQGWRAVASGPDRLRLRDWRKTWVAAITAARKAGHGSAIAAEGALLDPDSAQPPAAPPAGDYRCRTIKIGVRGGKAGDYIAYPAESCRIESDDGGLDLARLTGDQRAFGRLYPDAERRLVFLGTLQVGDEKGTLRYGIDEMRDLAGYVERIGPGRWRLALPAPHFESRLDVVELTPALPVVSAARW